VFAAASTDAVNRSIGASYGEVTAVSQTMRNFGGAFGLAVFSTIITGQLTQKLVASFHAIGGTAAQAQSAVNLVTGASGAGGSLRGIPAAAQAEILAAVQQDYAGSVQWAFFGMAISMAVLIPLALVYPSKRAGSASAAADQASAQVAV
jgi:hypothetical protein